VRDVVDPLADLKADPARYGFFAALRRVECENRALPRVGESRRAAEDPVRLGQQPSLAFTPSMLAAVDAAGARPRVLVNFFGLLGANGPMPAHFTEFVRDRERHAGDPAWARFLDLFHHRMLSLLYRAWASAQPTASFDRPDADHFGTRMAALAGLGLEALRGRDAVPDTAKLHFAGWLADRRRGAEGLTAILGDYFGVPVAVRQFVGHWLPLPDRERTRLGALRHGHRLGGGAVLGRATWNVQHKFRVVVGPLDFARFRDFLPGGTSWRRLNDWVRLHVGDGHAWDVQLVLARTQVPRLRLGSERRLGRDAWLACRAPCRDADHFVRPGSPAAVDS